MPRLTAHAMSAKSFHALPRGGIRYHAAAPMTKPMQYASFGCDPNTSCRTNEGASPTSTFTTFTVVGVRASMWLPIASPVFQPFHLGHKNPGVYTLTRVATVQSS